MNFTLNQRLLAITTAGVLTTALVVLALAYQIFGQVLRTRFEEKIALISRHLVSSAVVGLVFKDRLALKRLTENIFREKEITAVMIEDAEGKVLVSLGTPGPRDHLLVQEVKPALPPEGLVFSAKEALKPYGRVKIYYTTAPLEARLRALMWRAFGAGLLLALLVDLLLYFLVTRAVTTPLANLLKAVRRLQEGRLEFEAQPVSLPEVRTLSEAFAEMVVSLRKSREALARSYEEMARNQTLAEIGRCSLMIAHEIKNPLGIIKGSLDILKKAEVTPELKAQMLQYIEEEVKRIDLLVKNFLVFARPKEIKLAPLDLGELLRDIIKRLSLEEERLRISLEGEAPSFEGDAFWLEQVFVNLIKNAFEAGATQVICRLRQEEGQIIVEVEDNGPGIPEEKREEIFKPFFTEKVREGTGLGLAIVEQIVSLHGGRIEVLDSPSGGALFRLIFPKSPAPQGENTASVQRSGERSASTSRQK